MRSDLREKEKVPRFESNAELQSNVFIISLLSLMRFSEDFKPPDHGYVTET